jgi:ABC-type Na+ efflux pump permease subunit
MTEQVEGILVNFPPQVQQMLKGWPDTQIMAYVFALYIFAPFFLIIPLMASSVIASDSFAGEKERKTIEALLATPLSDSELMLGKILVAFIPSMLVSIGAFITYTVIVDLLTYTLFEGQLWLPNMLWLITMFGLAPVVALTSIGLTVLISARVKGFREAQQISAVLLVPVLALVFGQITGALIFGPLVVTGLIGLFGIIDLFIFRMSVRLFKREEILTKLS